MTTETASPHFTYVKPVHIPTGNAGPRVNVTGRSKRYIEREIKCLRGLCDSPDDWTFEIETSDR